MRRLIRLVLLLTVTPVLALAQAAGDPNAPPPPPPPDAAPAEGPPPGEASPPQAPPPPMQGSESVAPPVSPPPDAGPSGQWVNTSQYGQVWIPYGQQYTYIPGDPQAFPDQYVYYPAYGWRWVVAPWVYGYGPSPSWGPSGPRYFAWYARPWFRVGGYWGWGGYHSWGHYHGWVGPRSWGTHGWSGAPAYYRSGVGGPHPAQPVRTIPMQRGGQTHAAWRSTHAARRPTHATRRSTHAARRPARAEQR